MLTMSPSDLLADQVKHSSFSPFSNSSSKLSSIQESEESVAEEEEEEEERGEKGSINTPNNALGLYLEHPSRIQFINTMTSDSPTLQWNPFFEGESGLNTSNSEHDLFWSKYTHEDGNLSALSAYEARTETNNHGISSASSSQSGSDIFPSSSVHHLPAWNTMGNFEDEKNRKKLDQITHVSPGDAYSTSGLSDKHGDDGFKNDLWFIPSPETGSAPSAHLALQRKKRMQFVDPSNESASHSMKEAVGSPGASLPSKLKAFKSVPNLKRRISSGYTARLEELLSEMGWPKQNEQEGEEAQDGIGGDTTAQESEVGNETIIASSSSSNANPNPYSATSDGSFSHSGNPSTSASSGGGGAGNGGIGGGGGLSLRSTSSALYQRRADSRDGSMPVPAPVSVPKRPEDTLNDDNAAETNTDNFNFNSFNPDLANSSSSLSLAHPTSNDGHLSDTNLLNNLNTVSQSSMNQKRAAALIAQQQRLQQLADQVNGTGSMSTTSATATSDPNAGSSSGTSQNNLPLYQSSSVGQANISPATGRPNTASSGSNVTELHTPITPFVGMSLNNNSVGLGNGVNSHDAMSQLPWSANAAQSFSFTPQMASGSMGKNAVGIDDFALMQFGKIQAATNTDLGSKETQADYLASLQNSLGLYTMPDAPNSNSTSNAINPAAVLDPSTFASFPPMPNSAIGLMPSSVSKSDFLTSYPQLASNQHHQKLIFPPQQQKVMPVGQSAFSGQRPRAGTAMAALGDSSAHPSPRHMRSTPNLHMSPSPSMDGNQYQSIQHAPGSSSLHTTPNKSVRKIASNRRLNMLNATPETPSMQLYPGQPTIPNSPISPSKRGRNTGGMLSTSTSFGVGNTNFEFINYGIEDADELCSAVAPSGSYKVPLKGYGGDGDDDDDDEGGNLGDYDAEDGLENSQLPSSPRKSSGSKANRNGPRWEDAPPLPTATPNMTASASISEKVDDSFSNSGSENADRHVKRRKSDASMMLAGRKKSPSMSNLRKRD